MNATKAGVDHQFHLDGGRLSEGRRSFVGEREQISNNGYRRHAWSRRRFLRTMAAAGGAFAISPSLAARVRDLEKPIRLGFISDLHQDVMHDGLARLQAFVGEMQSEQPDAIVQLGDFAYPNEKNRLVTEAFHGAHPQSLHVLGNHDIDDGHTFDEVAERWEMPGRYYTRMIEGLQLIVLDGNEMPPNHRGGYPAHIGPQQLTWLKSTLAKLDGPAIVLSHQPLAGPSCIDNAEEVQAVLNGAADKILLTMNGHTHIDHVVRTGDIISLHINSASYFWVGANSRHVSYPQQIHRQYADIEYTCPYEKPLFTTLVIDPESGRLHLKGRQTQWVGESPAEVGKNSPGLTDGEEIVPQIRERHLLRAPV